MSFIARFKVENLEHTHFNDTGARLVSPRHSGELTQCRQWLPSMIDVCLVLHAWVPASLTLSSVLDPPLDLPQLKSRSFFKVYILCVTVELDCLARLRIPLVAVLDGDVGSSFGMNYVRSLPVRTSY